LTSVVDEHGCAAEGLGFTFELWKRLPRVAAVDEPAGTKDRNHITLEQWIKAHSNAKA
jgi:hypothetical protein